MGGRLLLPVLVVVALAAAAEAQERPVLAFYYGWYGNTTVSGQMLHWASPKNYADTPSLGLYDSSDEGTMRQHIRWAKQAGLDGFIVSWWGPGTFEDKNLGKLLKVAEQESFKVAVYYETWKNVPQGMPPGDPRQAIWWWADYFAKYPGQRSQALQTTQDDLRYILSAYGNSPAFMRYGGKPMVFFYSTLAFDAVFWSQAFSGVRSSGYTFHASGDIMPIPLVLEAYLAAFDSVHYYSPSQFIQWGLPLDKTYAYYALAAKVQGKPFFATAVPGYNDCFVRQPCFSQSRENGAYYQRFWDLVKAYGQGALVTSFNEWHEGTEIEPSAEYGSAYLTQTLNNVINFKPATIGPSSYRVDWVVEGPKKFTGWVGAEDQGMGTASADLNRNGKPDLILAHIDNPWGENRGYYRIGWDASTAGDAVSWTAAKQIPGWFGAEDQGMGAAAGDVNRNGAPDLVVTHIANPSGENAGYYRIGWDLNSNGDAAAWSAVKQIPGWFGAEDQGMGAALADINGNGILDLVVTHLTNPSGENAGYYRIGWDLNSNGDAASWSGPWQISGWWGGESQGMGAALRDINGNGRPELVVTHIDNPWGENAGYYRIGWDLGTSGAPTSWSAPTKIPGWFGAQDQGTGADFVDYDKDGSFEMLVGFIDNPSGENGAHYYLLGPSPAW